VVFLRDVIVVFLSTILIGVCGLYAYLFIDEHILSKHVTTPFSSEVPLDTLPSISPTKIMTKGKTLEEVIGGVLSGATSTYGVVVKNFRTNETYMYQEKEPFETASLYKLWVMATVYDQIEKNVLKETDMLSQDIAVLNKEFAIASEAAEQTEGVVTYTVGVALEKMITISDNYAALLLSERVGNSTIQQWLTNNGFSASFLGSPPKTTASDIALFLEKLYNGQLIDKTYSQKMIDLLKKQKLNNKLPKYLPEDSVIAHKTGELGGYTHDAGIVYTDKNTYSIVLLSVGENPDGAEERMSRISSVVFDYFEKTQE